jgi:hypothetical protein
LGSFAHKIVLGEFFSSLSSGLDLTHGLPPTHPPDHMDLDHCSE